MHVILACGWLFLVIIDIATIAKYRQPPQFVDAVLFCPALLCLGLENSSLILLTIFAAPFLCLGVLLRFPISTVLLLAFGFGGILTLGRSAFKGSLISQQNLLIALIIPVVPLLAGDANSLIARITPITYDTEFLGLDHGISTAIYMWALKRTWRVIAAYAIYVALPAAVALGIRFTLGRARVQLLWALCIAPVLAVLCFVIIPAVGPAHVGQPNAWRNCMPSLHLTWAFLLWLNASPRWWKVSSFLFVLLTVFATLATGEHYWIDLAVAIPFSYLVQWLSDPGVGSFFGRQDSISRGEGGLLEDFRQPAATEISGNAST